MAFPGHSAAADYVKEWQQYRPQADAVLVRLGLRRRPRRAVRTSPTPTPAARITYPFKSLDGTVTFERQKTGDRTFDYNKDGVAHYGLYADWFADLRRLGGPQLANDMWNGAEAYLEMWERADGDPDRRLRGGAAAV